MGAVAIRLRAELRAAWRSLLALAVLIGIFGGVVLGVAAGARRTETAFPRLTQDLRSSDVLFAPFAGGRDGYYDAVAREWSDEIVAMGVVVGLPVAPMSESGDLGLNDGNTLAPVDGRVGYSIDRPKVIEGRLPAPDSTDQVLVNEVMAEERNLRVGSRLPMGLLRPDPADPEGEPDVTPFDATVVGIGRFVEEVVPTARFDSASRMLMSEAAYQAYGRDNEVFFDAAFLRFRAGVDIAAFRESANRLARELVAEGAELLFADNLQRNRRVERAIQPQAVALWAFAGFLALATFLVLGQALVRLLTDNAHDSGILRTLGMTSGQVVGVAALRTAATATMASVIAVAVAVAISPLFPIGAARRAEPNGGFEANITLLAGGALALVVLFVARAAVPAWRMARATAADVVGDRSEAEAPSRLRRLLQVASLPPSAAAGVRMALEPGRGPTSVPVRATLVGAVVALAAVAATTTFAVNLDRVVNTPALYGRTWDLFFDGSFGGLVREPVERELRASPAVARWSGGYYGEALVGGQAVTAVSTDGPLAPAIVEGRTPRRADEVVLGTSTLERTGSGVGDTVEIAFGEGARRMRVVGRAVFPSLGRGSFPSTGLGEGVLTTGATIEPPPEAAGRTGNDFYNFYVIDLRPGASRAAVAALEDALRPLCDEGQACGFATDATDAERPAEITNLDRIRWTPVVLAGILAGLAVATVGHTLVTSIRRRRRDLALYKTIGFERGQVQAAVAWQASTFAIVAAVIGLPLGLAAGRVLWRALADQLGIVPDVATPGLALLLIAPATLVVANLIALVPGWMAGRVRPAVALRNE